MGDLILPLSSPPPARDAYQKALIKQMAVWLRRETPKEQCLGWCSAGRRRGPSLVLLPSTSAKQRMLPGPYESLECLERGGQDACSRKHLCWWASKNLVPQFPERTSRCGSSAKVGRIQVQGGREPQSWHGRSELAHHGEEDGRKAGGTP